MNLDLSSEQKLLQDSFAKLFSRESTPARVRAAEPLGFDKSLWNQLAAMGAPALRVPEVVGGAAGTLFDALLLAEQAGRHLASAPLMEAIVANRVLGLVAGKDGADWLARAISGTIVCVALQDAGERAVQLVPGGAVADAVLALDGDTLVLVHGRPDRKAPATFGATPLASWDLARPDRFVLGSGAKVREAFLAGIEEWKLLTAAMAGAMARRALDIAADYAKERQSFGRPIGSYQGLAHPMADAVTAVDGARLLAWRTVSELAGRQRTAAAAIALTWWWTARASQRATTLAMRVLGGYGMSLEYDPQLYFRRAGEAMLALGDPRDELSRAGERLWGGENAHPVPETGDVGIDFGLGAAAERMAERARKFFRENLVGKYRDFVYESHDGYDPEMMRRLAGEGLLHPDWPREDGGPVASIFELSALRRVYCEFGWGLPASEMNGFVAHTLMEFGSEAAKREVIPGILSGEITCALGYTEPEGGSDIFAAKTRATRDGDDWLINGQKTFTSRADVARFALTVTRTDPSAPKHLGLTMFLVPLDPPGFSCTRMDTIGSERTNVTYFSDLRVSDKYRVGEVNGGLKVLAAALTMEQTGGEMNVGALDKLLEHAVAWAKGAMRGGKRAIDIPEVRSRLAEVAAHAAVAEVLARRCMWASVQKDWNKAWGPMSKLFGSEARVVCSQNILELAAPDSLLRGGESAPGWIELEARRAIPSTIYGGTSEVMRSVIAESLLGLPRTRG